MSRRIFIAAAFCAVLSGAKPASVLAEIPDPEQQAITAFAESAGVRAVNFRQGDANGFSHRRNDFTPDGWKDFMKIMQPYLDEKGAPTFSSSFIASGSAKIVEHTNGFFRIRIPGTLTQGNNTSRTAYRAALEITARGRPVKIQKLEQITCVGLSPTCQ